jgi:hypothetical protein
MTAGPSRVGAMQALGKGTRESLRLLGRGVRQAWRIAKASMVQIMARSAPIKLRPSAADLAISNACLRLTSPSIERPLRVVAWRADEKTMLAAATAFWAMTRFGPSRPLQREADQMLCSVLIAGAIRHLCKGEPFAAVCALAHESKCREWPSTDGWP